MKTFLKIFAVIAVIFVAALFILPYFFQDKAKEILLREINDNVEAVVSFDNVNLSFFRNFPSLSLNIEGLKVVGKAPFSGDTLAHIHHTGLVLEIMPLIKNAKVVIDEIVIDRAALNIITLKGGKTNYDIGKTTEEDSTETADTTGTDFAIRLKSFRVSDSRLIYDDRDLGFYVRMEGLHSGLRGDFTAAKTNLGLQMEAGDVTMSYENSPLLSHVRVKYKAWIDADLEHEIYSLKSNVLDLNELSVEFAGNFSFVGDDLNTIMTFKTPRNDFKSLLSLIPVFYRKSFEQIRTRGEFELSGSINGIYTDDRYPNFKLSAAIHEAQIQYPGLPGNIDHINMNVNIKEEGGQLDNTIVDLSRLSLTMGENPVQMSMLLSHPVSDPHIDANLKAGVDLAGIKNYYPLEESEQMSGKLKADMRFKGNMSSIEKEKYEDFEAVGNLLLSDFRYPAGQLLIKQAQLNFSPAYIDLAQFILEKGGSRISLQGKVQNYIPYYLDNKELYASLMLQSDNIDLQDFMQSAEGESTGTENPSDTAQTASGIIEIPANIHFDFNASIRQLQYDKMLLHNVTGNLVVKDEKVDLQNLSMLLDQSQFSLSGWYSAKNRKPEADMRLQIKDIEARDLYDNFDIVQSYFPFVQNATGKMNTKWAFHTPLDNNMSPVYAKLSGGGEISSDKIVFTRLEPFAQVASQLHIKQLSTPAIDAFSLQFEVKNGSIETKPFPLTIGGLSGTMQGTTGLDKSIHYQWKTKIPKTKLSGQALHSVEAAMKKLNVFNVDIGIPDEIPLTIFIEGEVQHPQTRFSFDVNGASVQEQVKKKVEEEVKKKKKEVSEEARRRAQKIIDEADGKARQIIAEAEKQAAAIKNQARKAAAKINNEADNQAKNIIAQAKGKGFLAEAAAKETAKGIKSKAKQQADKLVAEADHKADKLVNTAKNQARQIKKKAQEEADKITKI